MMKKYLLVSLMAIFLVCPLLNGQTVINDPNFEQALIDLKIDDVLDGVVENDSIQDLSSLDVSSKNIGNLIGIEAFATLETLICSNNSLEILDVSSNTNLKSLLCGSNELVSLDVSALSDLELLDFSNNRLTDIVLQVGGTVLNPLLNTIIGSNNRLSNIDVSLNTELTSLAVSNNQLSGELIVGNNINLESLFCAFNQITILNLSTNTNLTTLNASNNQLVSLNIQNGFNDLITAFNSEDNQDLFCVQIDAGFAVSLVDNLAWVKDDWTYYGETACPDIYTYVPDDNFENALIALGHDAGAPDNFVLTATISLLTDLPISGAGIEDLTGIEDFTALTNIDCSNNSLTRLDLSANINLIDINCSANILPNLDVSANTALENLNCSAQVPYDDVDDTKDYTFNNLNIGSNTNLLILDCSNNDLTELNIANNTLLTNLDCSFNNIEALNVSGNGDLISFICNNNALQTLNVVNGNNVGIGTFNSDVNPNLSCIEVDAIPAPAAWNIDPNSSYSLGCGTYVPDDNFENYLETHDASGAVVGILSGLGMGDGVMNNFVPTANINTVVTLTIPSLVISDLKGIEDFIALTDLDCSDNALTRLDLSANVNLDIVDCSSNLIENLDFSPNTVLTSLLCDDNNLFTLSIKNTNNGNLLTFDASANPFLYCIQVDDEANIGGTWVVGANTGYGEDCELNRFTTIIDDNFEQALIDMGLDAGPLDNLVLTSKIEHLLSLDVSDKNIQDLSGIQDFAALQELDCSGNSLNELNVSGMMHLEFLNCNSNYLTTNNSANATGVLNTDGTNSLTKIFCASNLLEDLDVSTKPLLEELDCGDNDINVLDVTANPELRILNATNNNLLSLDVSQNTKLEEVSCDNNQIANLTTIGVANSTLKKLSCSYNNLPTLVVENYLILETLNCHENDIDDLNVTANPALERLDFTNNNIDDIDLVNNTSLVTVLASQNRLPALDVSTNTLLETLNCDNNEIATLEVENATALKYLYASGNDLTGLDLSNNSNLIELNVSSNVLTTLDLSGNLSTLKTFNCSSNSIVSDIDLSSMGTTPCPPASTDPNNPEDYCPETITINVSGNPLTYLDIKNTVNTDIASLNATGNPDLDCIQVDDANAIGLGWVKDATATYNEICRFGETYVPDDNFETALITLGYDALPLDDYVLTSQIDALISLDISGSNIADLTGIEDFVALEVLNCSNNALTTFDLKKNVSLTDVNCADNNFSILDIADNVNLITLNCSGNSLFDLDLTANTNLTSLNISNNGFITFLPSEIATLQDFNCDSNQLTNLDLSSNAALISLSCESNLLETLNLKNGQNINLTNLNAQNNVSLSCIETDTGNEPNGVVWLKDATTEYQIDCHYGLTYVPDDAFEQALINIGIDSGVLDDYVPTNKINRLRGLDVSAKAIGDLTGIEGFEALESLNFSNNSLIDVDLTNNILLEELDASNNMFTDIDLSFNTSLQTVNLSGNILADMDLSSNSDLLELNISNNELTMLNVDALTVLETLDCSSNLLESLSVQLNAQLVNLYCQSNSFISDQLNLQNGANINLVNFNATENENLKCILVDDPFTVITNAGGVYDNWFKDFTSNYQTVCVDADNDGVNNEDDLCPNSVFGQPVDLFGCEYLSLPNNNFTVLITGETCLNSNNGKINITATEIYNYKATLFNDTFTQDYLFTNDVEIRNLLAGTYKMCITIEEWPDYISCYDVVINHPEELAVLTNKNSSTKKVSLELFGNSSYNIDVNGASFKINSDAITLNLKEGANTIKVSTDLECQGVYEENIFISNSFTAYPNPFNDNLNIYLGKIDAEVSVNIHSYLGQVVYSKKFAKEENHNLSIDTGNLTQGFYSISIQSNTSTSTFKMIKK